MLDQDEIDDLMQEARSDRKWRKNDRLVDGDPDKITDDDLEEAED
jgi:hypothetical protein